MVHLLEGTAADGDGIQSLKYNVRFFFSSSVLSGSS